MDVHESVIKMFFLHGKFPLETTTNNIENCFCDIRYSIKKESANCEHVTHSIPLQDFTSFLFVIECESS